MPQKRYDPLTDPDVLEIDKEIIGRQQQAFKVIKPLLDLIAKQLRKDWGLNWDESMGAVMCFLDTEGNHEMPPLDKKIPLKSPLPISQK